MKSFSFKVLLAAALYNILWGGVVIAFPNLFFDLAGLTRPNYPEIWQCVGMIVGVYGIGYAAAAFDPVRFWPVILVGFLGKIFGPLGFIKAIYEETFNFAFGINIVFNDLIWWIPFFLILKWVAGELAKPNYDDTEEINLNDELENFSFNGKTLLEHSNGQELTLEFTRHSGCTFCRKQKAEHQGKTVLVTMSKQADHPHPIISDPGQRLYRVCKIGRANWKQAFGPQVIWPGIKAFLFEKHFVGLLEGDGFQLGGVAVIKDGKLLRSETAKDVTQTCLI